jgi:HAD superfamily hydrolase (TIGR01549 family)
MGNKHVAADRFRIYRQGMLSGLTAFVKLYNNFKVSYQNRTPQTRRFSENMGTAIAWAKIRVVIFDCDGVMFDSRQANEAYYNHILAHFGKPEMTMAQRQFVHMHTARQSVAHLFEDDPRAEAAEAYRQQMSYFPFIAKMRREPYLKRFLTYLRPSYKTAIATNRSDTMGRVLEEHGLQEDFDLVVSCLDVTHPKPAPDALFKILAHFSLSAPEALYIGDSEIDEKTAMAARVPFVAYKNRALAADCYIEHFGDIEAFLEAAAGGKKEIPS